MPVLEPDGARGERSSRSPRPIRVLFLAAQIGRVSNGVGTYATALGDALARAGHEVTLVTASTASVAGSVRRVTAAPLDPSPGQWLSIARAFAREVSVAARERRYDLVHFADAREALYTSRVSGVPIVGSVHDDYAASAPRSPLALRRLHPDPWKRAAYYAVLRRLERIAYRKLDLLVANSRSVALSIAVAYGISTSRVRVVHPSIPDDRPMSPGEKLHGDPAILFVGTNFFRKGLATLFEAAVRLRPRLPNLSITIVGNDPRRGAAEALAERLDLVGRVHFLGHRDRRDVLELYGRADLLAVPSHTEGFGLVYLEAMRAGLPVIGGNAGGTRELVRDGVHGLLVPPGDAATLAHAIQRLHDDASLRERLVAAGRRHSESFSIRTCLEHTLAAYAEALEERKRAER